MERGINYIIVGLIFIASLVGLVIFIFWFSGSSIFSGNIATYKAYINEASSIKIETPIKYKGINVGRVSDVKFQDNNFDVIEITIEINKDLKIKKDSVLALEQNGLLGGSYLSLVQNEKSSEFIDSNSVLHIKKDSMSTLLSMLPSITGKIDELVNNANGIINKENANNVALSLISIKETANSINAMIKALQKNTNNIDSIIESLNKAAVNTNKVIELVNHKIKSGEYDFKSTITPVLISMEESLQDLQALARRGTSLMDNLKDDPYNTIFGYKERK